MDMEGSLLAAGSVIDGRYALTERLGDGTFGEVWRAADQRLSGRPVAVKFLKAEFGDRAEVVARFEAEVDALARLAHPNVVAVLDRGQWSRRRYFVMESVDAGTLRAWLDRHRAEGRRPELAEARRIFDAVCAGVEAAHAVMVPGPIVHRDLKPENVLLRAQPGAEVLVKVLDFGVAQLGGRQGTSTGMLLGTPEYMAPEQAMGQVSGVGPWTDVFSLGVVLVELLTLQSRSTGEEVWWGTSLKLAGNVRPLLAAARDDVPAAVWDAVVRALQTDGRDRYPNAGALRAALRSAWEAPPVQRTVAIPAMTAPPDGTPPRTVAIPAMTAPTPSGPPRTMAIPGMSAPPSDPGGQAQWGFTAPPPGPFPTPAGWAGQPNPTARPTSSSAGFSNAVIGALALCLVVASGVWIARRRPRPAEATVATTAAPAEVAPPAPPPPPDPPPARPEDDPDRVYALALPPDPPCLGPASAPVTLEHFSDFQCPFCSRVTPTLQRIRDAYGDRVRICWRDYPLPMHPAAMPAAEAGREVRRQLGDEAFWRYHDRIFAISRGLTEELVTREALEVGASARPLRRAMSAHTHQAAVRAEMAALDASITGIGVPTSFVNGRQLRGALPYERFVAAIDRALAERR